MSRIFISYRRSDAAAEAGRIYDYLESRFGRDSIFIDVDVLRAGDDFQQRINEAVGQCQVLLAVIGGGWLQAKDARGRRLDNPADWVRLEIETALRRNIRVIPVLSEGVVMPSVSDLPKSLQPLAYRHAAFVRHNRDFRGDMDRLSGDIQRCFEDLARPPAQPLPAQPSPTQSSVAPPSSDPPSRSTSLSSVPNKPQGTLKPQRVVPSPPASTRSTPNTAPKFGSLFSRRRTLQIIGSSAGGLSAVLAGKALLQNIEKSSSTKLADWQLPALKPSTTDGTTVEFNVATVNVQNKSIEMARKVGEFFTEVLSNSVTLDLMKIPDGTFIMGSPADEIGREDDEGPQHEVTVPSFFMGEYPVTQAQWQAVASLPKIERDLNASPASFKGDNRPVETVSWDDAIEFCQRLSVKTKKEYRLPSEAEWEYACRAGTTTPFHVGKTITTVLANYNGTNSYGDGPKGKYLEETTDVGSFPANAFGLYDMHGNVWEWCQDYWHNAYENAPADGSAWLTGGEETSRMVRGGSWNFNPAYCRSAFRLRYTPTYRNGHLGFRVVVSVSP